MGQNKHITKANMPSWWKEGMTTGDVPPELIAFDLDQPRKNIEGTRLFELARSIDEVGVRQRVVLALRHQVPDVRVAPEHEDRPFVSVAGERRTRASIIANCPTVPVEFRDYEGNKTAYLKDQCATNIESQALSVIEEAQLIASLRDKGLTNREISPLVGIPMNRLSRRENLVVLAPDIIEANLNPHKPRSEQMGIGLADELANLLYQPITYLKGLARRMESLIEVPDVVGPDVDLQHLHQHIWLDVIRGRGLSDKAGIILIKETTGITPTASRKVKPAPITSTPQQQEKGSPPVKRTDLMILRNFINQLEKGAPFNWTPNQFLACLAILPQEQLKAYQLSLKTSGEMLLDLAGKIEVSK